MPELTVEIVAVDRSVWTGSAKVVILKTVEGDMGLLPGHEPVLAMLSDGPVRVDPIEGDPILFAVHGGFFSMDTNHVRLLAEVAEVAEEIDIDRAKAAKQRVVASGGDDPEEVAALRRAETRIDVAMKEQGLAAF
jgi:F-type H+-transporting ATPase subunit epsilon